VRVVKVAEKQMHWLAGVSGAHLSKDLFRSPGSQLEFLRREVPGDIHEAARRKKIGLGFKDLMSQLSQRWIKVRRP
jgi:hypothetical protein